MTTPSARAESLWKKAAIAYAAALALELLDSAVAVSGSGRDARLAVALVSFGWALVVTTLLLGVSRRSRWGFWWGLIVAGASALLLALGLGLQLLRPGLLVLLGMEVTDSPLSQGLTLARIVAYAAACCFLAGILRAPARR
jgi:hypothetical protein